MQQRESQENDSLGCWYCWESIWVHPKSSYWFSRSHNLLLQEGKVSLVVVFLNSSSTSHYAFRYSSDHRCV